MPDLPNLTDRALIERTFVGDTAARDTLITRIYPALGRAVARVLSRRAPDRIADVVQETVLRLLAADKRALRSFRGEDLAPYACKIARNAALDVLRRLDREPQQLNRPADVGGPPASELKDEDPDSGLDTESVLRVLRMREGLRRAMKAVLNEREQKALVGVYVLGWSRREAAEHLSTNENNVDQILFRARRKLADALGADGRLLLQ